MRTADPGALQGAFRQVMGSVCTPVSVVTGMRGGHPHGTTVSAFSSLSMNPPMVLVALDRDSQLLAMIRRTARFGLNVLSSRQADVALAFAQKSAAKFDGASWRTEHDVPRLEGVAGFVACDIANLVDGGDHVIVLGAVRAAESVEKPPLTYHDRAFGTHSTGLPEPA